ncbi:hypothetical protein K2Q00_00150 [Patescibacteria group bacterium]|nr:hypothetical protein [Patescibacteria group bacterium]
MENKEPSNQTLLESINERFNMVFQRLEKQDGKFALISHQLGSLLQGQAALGERVGAIDTTLEEIQVTLGAFGKAIDADALTLVGHQERITRLEEKTA